jgi:hypothetical protein
MKIPGTIGEVTNRENRFTIMVQEEPISSAANKKRNIFIRIIISYSKGITISYMYRLPTFIKGIEFLSQTKKVFILGQGKAGIAPDDVSSRIQRKPHGGYTPFPNRVFIIHFFLNENGSFPVHNLQLPGVQGYFYQAITGLAGYEISGLSNNRQPHFLRELLYH